MLPLEEMLTVEKLIQDKASYGTMNIFGIIVYTEEHPFIAKVLRDKDYWASLNARTKNWILYAIRPDENHGHLTDEYILPQLGIDNSKDLPQLVIIAIGPNKTLMQHSFPIDDNDEVTAYRSIEEQINIVTEAAANIYPEYRYSTHVHREAVRALEAEMAKKEWKKVTIEGGKFIWSLYKAIKSSVK